MKYFLLLLLLCFSESSVALSTRKPEDDTLHRNQADMELESGNYQKACSLYIYMDKCMDYDYTEINSYKVEDLRQKYPINEVLLQKKIIQNKILLLTAWVGAFILCTFIGYFFCKQQQNKRLLHSQEALNQAKTLAEESIRNKSIFLSNMSHEIKTPLNALSGFSEVLTMPGIDEETRQQCNSIIQLNSELLLKLLDDVIDISCLDVANMNFRVKPCEVVKLCQHIVTTVTAIKQTDANISFETDFTSLELETDAERLQQMLINLLVNATKFAKQGSIILKLEQANNNEVQFSVTDTGCGIPLEQQPYIFQRFEKLNEKAQGTGLGLSICLLIIKRLDGNIWIDSEYKNGARFVFTHPLKQKVRL